MTKPKRTRIFIVKEPAPGKRYYTLVYWPGEIEPEILGGVTTQRQHLIECRALAKKTAGASIYVAGKDGRYREVYSFPPVKNSDERKKAAK